MRQTIYGLWYIVKRQRDHKLARHGMVHPRLSFLPISEHNIECALVKLTNHFVRNRRLWTSVKPPVDRRFVSTDLKLRQQVVTAIGRHLRENLPKDSGVDYVDTAVTIWNAVATPEAQRAWARSE